MSSTSQIKDYSHLFLGLDLEVPTLDGGRRRYINLDNAASTPPLLAAQRAVVEFMPYYSSVHRGTGFKSQLSTHAYEAAREIVMAFFGADKNDYVCIFGKNTTEALNKLARRFPLSGPRDIVVTTGMEHHSNDLPWRMSAPHLIHVPVLEDGSLNEGELARVFDDYGSRIALVAITGASNVTGYINPIHEIAERAHAIGAQIAVDCAQLAPHRAIDLRSLDDPSHLDYIAVSAHKMYAPFGTGALIGRRDTFEQGDPDYTGGGTVDLVTLNQIDWAGAPERDEAGSPNTVGAIAFAASLLQLDEIGMDNVAAHEADLTRYALERFSDSPEVEVYGDTDPGHASNRLGAIPINIKGFSHFLVSAIMGFEFGIGVRSGCFCAHPYIIHL
ncbi:MAG: aminotransferase class V-fold PLP-dependent enzyme, partial [Anaerolineales bacterium]|nr:aminotransferase class V-fold PLP-dependent enzyme [Anaerolineales bacterium]